jgi:hypothetical protein
MLFERYLVVMPRRHLEEGKNGRNCVVTGVIMWEAHQDSYQCKSYGTNQFGNGFMASVNYTYICDNRDSVLPMIGTIRKKTPTTLSAGTLSNSGYYSS